MIVTYKNIRLCKSVGKVSILSKAYVEFENADDELIYKMHSVPYFIQNMIETKIIHNKYDKFSIYGVKKSKYSKIDEYKRIWKLAEIPVAGEYDTSYFVDDGIIYLGIKKENNCWKNTVFSEKIVVLFKKNDKIDYNKLFNIFRENKYDFTNLSSITPLIKAIIDVFNDAIIINETYDDDVIIDIYGNNIEKNFLYEDFLQTDIVEKN